MRRRGQYSRVLLTAAALIMVTGPPLAAEPAKLLVREADPHSLPRPARDARHVPRRTSIYFELGPSAEGAKFAADAVIVQLVPAGQRPVRLLERGQRFAAGVRGWLRRRQVSGGTGPPRQDGLAVYIEPPEPLQPAKRYTVQVLAKTDQSERAALVGQWSFTTEAAEPARLPPFRLDLSAPPARWHGAFFSGFCTLVFCAPEENWGPTLQLMRQAQRQHPRAWSYQRGIWLCGSDDDRPWWSLLMDPRPPNIVRERQTRRITAIDQQADGTRLTVEDVFGHQLYGIPSGRPLSADYHPGDEVLVADGVHDARARVVAVDDRARTVLVSPLATPEGGWRLRYMREAPEVEDPDAPGRFPAGGCYLRKFAPPGTPCYFWRRLDTAWDRAVLRDGRRLVVNFVGAFTDLAVDGRGFTTAKDLAQWHEVVRTITDHVIERYGRRALEFRWSVFNEPDLMRLFWRSDWNELQRFYDYTVDAVLRAFEDRGYDSRQVMVGGLELGAIFGTHLKLREFLAHCSPRAEARGALEENAVVADPRLAGRRSRRVEQLCRDHGGRGSPCDFISIHAYNRSEVMAAKLIRAKEMALEMDPDYFADLWVDCHESCPAWNVPPDEAAGDVYRGNGYFPSWCLDVVTRQLRRAAADPRYGYGESVITIWPPPRGMAGLNAFTRVLGSDDDDDGNADRWVTLPSPIFHALNLLSDFGPRYWVMPEQQSGGHTVSGFASIADDKTVRVAVYAHHPEDTQSRSATELDIPLELAGLPWAGPVAMTEYRFDKQHNSYYRLARKIIEQRAVRPLIDRRRVDALVDDLKSGDAAVQQQALEKLEQLGVEAVRAALPALFQLSEESSAQSLRDRIQKLLQRMMILEQQKQVTFSRQRVETLEQMAQLQETRSARLARSGRQPLKLTVQLAGNGASFLVLRASR